MLTTGPPGRYHDVTLKEAPLDQAPTPPTREALERLFLEHHAVVYRAAYRLTGSAMDAEDVLQTVFLRLTTRETLPPLGDRPEAYLRRAAVNAALDLVRARSRTSPIDGQDPVDSAPSPQGESEGRELKRRLRQALTNLSPKAAELFSMKYLEGMDNREIARITGTSPGVIAVLLFRARARLRLQLEDLLEPATNPMGATR